MYNLTMIILNLVILMENKLEDFIDCLIRCLSPFHYFCHYVVQMFCHIIMHLINDSFSWTVLSLMLYYWKFLLENYVFLCLICATANICGMECKIARIWFECHLSLQASLLAWVICCLLVLAIAYSELHNSSSWKWQRYALTMCLIGLLCVWSICWHYLVQMKDTSCAFPSPIYVLVSCGVVPLKTSDLCGLGDWS